MSYSSSASTSVKSTTLAKDELFEIFLLLPLKSIFKFRCVSKHWLSILTDPFFMSKWMIINNFMTSPSWTMIYGISPKSYDYNHPDKPEVYQPFSIATLDIHSRYVSDSDGFSFKFSTAYPFPLASSNGLILCSTSLNYQERYLVCNPLTKKFQALPVTGTRHDVVLNSFICQSSPSSSTYKVIRIIPLFTYTYSDSYKKIFNLEIFSSESGQWNTFKVLCPPDITWKFPMKCDLVNHNGILYWFAEREERIIVYDLNNNGVHGDQQCTLINLPADRRPYQEYETYPYRPFRRLQCLAESEGFICYAQIHRRQRSLSVWVLEKDNSDRELVWNLMHKDVEFMDIDISTNLLGINPLDRNVLILDFGTNILAYNLLTGESELLNRPSYLFSDSKACYSEDEIPPIVVQLKVTILPSASWEEPI